MLPASYGGYYYQNYKPKSEPQEQAKTDEAAASQAKTPQTDATPSDSQTENRD